MKTLKTMNVLLVISMLLTSVFTTSCTKDQDVQVSGQVGVGIGYGGNGVNPSTCGTCLAGGGGAITPTPENTAYLAYVGSTLQVVDLRTLPPQQWFWAILTTGPQQFSCPVSCDFDNNGSYESNTSVDFNIFGTYSEATRLWYNGYSPLYLKVFNYSVKTWGGAAHVYYYDVGGVFSYR